MRRRVTVGGMTDYIGMGSRELTPWYISVALPREECDLVRLRTAGAPHCGIDLVTYSCQAEGRQELSNNGFIRE